VQHFDTPADAVAYAVIENARRAAELTINVSATSSVSARPCAHGYWYGHCPLCHGTT
jgi:hypothetical protein